MFFNRLFFCQGRSRDRSSHWGTAQNLIRPPNSKASKSCQGTIRPLKNGSGWWPMGKIMRDPWENVSGRYDVIKLQYSCDIPKYCRRTLNLFFRWIWWMGPSSWSNGLELWKRLPYGWHTSHSGNWFTDIPVLNVQVNSSHKDMMNPSTSNDTYPSTGFDMLYGVSALIYHIADHLIPLNSHYPAELFHSLRPVRFPRDTSHSIILPIISSTNHENQLYAIYVNLHPQMFDA